MYNPKSLKERLVKGSVITLTLALIGSILAYLVRILLSRTLTVENYGLYYAVFALFSVVTAYVDLGFGYAVVYLFPKYAKAKKYSKAWNVFIYGQTISITTSIIASILFIAFAPILTQKYFKLPGSEILIYIFCVYLISFTVINGLIQIFTGFQKEKYFSSIAVLRWLLTIIFSFSFLLLGLSNIYYYAIALVSGHLLTALIFSLLLAKKFTFLIKNKIVWEKPIFAKMCLFAVPSLLETLVVSAIILGDNLFLTLFKGLKEVGVYNIVYPLASIPLVLINPINGLLLPLVSHLMEGEKVMLKFLMEKILQAVPFIWLYFSLFTIIFPSTIVGLTFGQKWVGLVEIPVIILSLGVLPMMMNGIFGAITLGTGRVKEKLKVAVFTAIFSVIASGFSTYHYGVLGAVISGTCVALIVCLLFGRIIYSVISFQIPYYFYLKLLIFSVLAYTLIKITGINPKNWFEFIMSGLIYSVVYFILGYLLRIYDQKFISIILGKK